MNINVTEKERDFTESFQPQDDIIYIKRNARDEMTDVPRSFHFKYDLDCAFSI